jgi:hypothetical protein
MSKYGLLTVLLSLGMLVVGCAAPDDDLEPPLTIHDTAWQVTSYDDGDGNLVEVLAGTEALCMVSPAAMNTMGFTTHPLKIMFGPASISF